MRDFAMFQMWGPTRQALIESHRFYVDQANVRLLSQFQDMEAEAEKAAEGWLETNGRYFDPDRHDEGFFYERANEVGIEFYQMLADMREQTRLSVVAGMFQLWDKQLREWLVREMRHWHRGETAVAKVWTADFVMIADLLESLGWKLRSAPFYEKLDECRLVVNVHKHGDGTSLKDLKHRFPHYLLDPAGNPAGRLPDLRYRDHMHLRVSDDQIEAFSSAIVQFWQQVPDNVSSSQVDEVPDWFGKAILKDRQPQAKRV